MIQGNSRIHIVVQISFGLIGQYCMVHQGTKKVECVSVRGMNEQSRIVLHTWSAYHSVAVTGMARYTCIARYIYVHGSEELSCVWSAVPECGCQGYGKGTI